MLDHGQLRCFGLTHQRAFGHQRLAYAPGNRRRHARVVKVDAGGFHRCLARGQIGLGLLAAGHHADVLLLAHGVGLHQRLVACGLGAGLGEVGLGLGQAGLRALKAGPIQRRVNLEQRLACLDLAAFAKQPLQHHAIDAGTHLRHTRRAHPARQFGLQSHGLQSHGDHPHFGRGRGFGRGCGGAWRSVFGTTGD